MKDIKEVRDMVDNLISSNGNWIDKNEVHKIKLRLDSILSGGDRSGYTE